MNKKNTKTTKPKVTFMGLYIPTLHEYITHGYYGNIPIIIQSVADKGLKIRFYDKSTNQWKITIASANSLTKTFRTLYKDFCIRSFHAITSNECEQAMKHERVHKSSRNQKSGCSTDLRMKQGTEYAYHAYMKDPMHSGNASVVGVNWSIESSSKNKYEATYTHVVPTLKRTR